MATTASPTPEAPAPINHVGRLFGALFNPKPTFQEIVQRPSWIAPIILLTILSIGVGAVMAQKVNWERVVMQKIEQSPRAAQLSPEQKQQQAAMGAKFAGISVYVFGLVGPIVFALILAAIFLGEFNLFAGAGLRFGTAMAVVSHAMMPSAISSVLGIAVLLLKDPESLDPNNLVATNLGALVSSDSPKWLEKLAASVDVFWVWIFLLFAIGFAAANPKKVSTGKALGYVFGLYLAFRLVVVLWAAI